MLTSNCIESNSILNGSIYKDFQDIHNFFKSYDENEQCQDRTIKAGLVTNICTSCVDDSNAKIHVVHVVMF
jgi:hypothetical protein